MLSTEIKKQIFNIIVLIIFAGLFFIFKIYWAVVLMLFFMLIQINIERVTSFKVGKDGMSADFSPPKENIKEDIKDNKKIPTEKNVKIYENVENKVIKWMHEELGGELKQQVHFINKGKGFTPDGTIQTAEGMIFLEIKHVFEAKYAEDIVDRGIKKLESILEDYTPYMKGKNLKAILVIVGDEYIKNIPKSDNNNIEIRFFNIKNIVYGK